MHFRIFALRFQGDIFWEWSPKKKPGLTECSLVRIQVLRSLWYNGFCNMTRDKIPFTRLCWSSWKHRGIGSFLGNMNKTDPFGLNSSIEVPMTFRLTFFTPAIMSAKSRGINWSFHQSPLKIEKLKPYIVSAWQPRHGYNCEQCICEWVCVCVSDCLCDLYVWLIWFPTYRLSMLMPKKLASHQSGLSQRQSSSPISPGPCTVLVWGIWEMKTTWWFER